MIAEKEQETVNGVPKLLTIHQVAKILSVSPKTLYAQTSSGAFPVPLKRIGKNRGLLRFRLQDVNDYINAL